MEILTVKDVASLLKVADKTVYVMAQRSEIPAFKIRGQWRFRKNDIERWIDNKTVENKQIQPLGGSSDLANRGII